VAPVIDAYKQEMVQKGLSMEELDARIAFIRKVRDAMMKEQLSKGIPMPYDE
jgi:hypothetical protein